tara:strand:+ start:6444 stop:6854 length:411 start_codon:yes stop_codon:yes gene_type:complete
MGIVDVIKEVDAQVNGTSRVWGGDVIGFETAIQITGRGFGRGLNVDFGIYTTRKGIEEKVPYFGDVNGVSSIVEDTFEMAKRLLGEAGYDVKHAVMGDGYDSHTWNVSVYPGYEHATVEIQALDEHFNPQESDRAA